MAVAFAMADAPEAAERFIIPFELAGDEPVERIGGKCIGLAALVRAKAPVSPGFVLTTDAFAEMMQVDGLGKEIAELLQGLDVDNFENEARVSREIGAAIERRQMPEVMERAIRAAYARLGSEAHGDAAVAVRSSGTAEDLPDASFAGQGDTYLGVVGADEVVAKVKRCWASLYSARAMSYRAQNSVDHLDVQMAVAVQVMVQARSAGVAMTLDPANGDRSKIIIESTWGLGETLVSGEVTPDHFLIDKVMLIPVTRRIAEKDHELVVDPVTRHAVHRQVPEERRCAPSISEEELKTIAQAAKTIERTFRCPQDIEWAIDEKRVESGGVVILQSRPETVWSKRRPQTSNAAGSAFGVSGVLGALVAPMATKNNI
jgi:pyruvate,water dikinase